ncbi:YdhK family protein [Macrococcus animalis]|uniref:YdhK family protein n=1 Tax=Macrococcus animalis TaxID=3395467 RepID=UPI0039BDEFF6
MMNKLIAIIASTGILLSGCGGHKEANHDEHAHMNHNNEATPKNMVKATNPKYNVGDEVKITEEHMAGMKDAEGKVKEVYTTYVYEVSYQPKNGDKKVNNHKWVVNEELKDAPKSGFKKGEKAEMTANHMDGMKGAEATIDDVKQTDVYVVDYKDTKTDKLVKDHKWMTEDELSSK